MTATFCLTAGEGSAKASASVVPDPSSGACMLLPSAAFRKSRRRARQPPLSPWPVPVVPSVVSCRRAVLTAALEASG